MSEVQQNKAPSFGYSCYVLGVLVVVYIFNFIDRQILSILNESIKADLGLSDARMAFLYGTAFAVFYAVFGIPLGRLADTWSRRSLISLSLAVWSAMTALSGLSQNFFQLGLARTGVAVGEAGATPAAFSLLSDSFSPARRATVLAIYSGGIYVGAGLGLSIGGQVVTRWNNAYAGGAAPFDLAGWQVAFFVVGLPGLLMALLVRTLREPLRGAMDGIVSAVEPHPFRVFGRELAAILPGLSLLELKRKGATRRDYFRNAGVALALALACAVLIRAGENPEQWIALAIGLYCTATWAQGLALRDPPTAALVLGTRSLLRAEFALAGLAFSGYGAGYWVAPFFIRFHDIPIEQVGNILGGITAVCGFLGIIFGGVMADAWRRRNVAGRLYVGIVTALAPLPAGFLMLTTKNTTLALVANAVLSFTGAAWIGAGASTIQDAVLPRMRATASALYLLIVTFIGLALGPYTVGRVSDLLDLRYGIAAAGIGNLWAVVFFFWAARTLERDQSTMIERARAAGEPGLD